MKNFLRFLQRQRRLAASNEEAALTVNFDSAANETAVSDGGNEAGDGWVRLAPYGKFPHPVGDQVVTPAAANELVKGFQGAMARLKAALFGKHEPPIYFRHPDDASASNADDNTVYGGVQGVEARADGVYIKPSFSDIGRDMLANATKSGQKLFYSGRWMMSRLADGTCSPFRLLSVGLTPRPNIAGSAAANEAPISPTMKTKIEKLLRALGGYTDAQILAAANEAADAPTVESIEARIAEFRAAAGKLPEAQTALTAANEAKTKLEGELTTLRAAKTKADTDLTAANEAAGKVRAAAEDRLLDLAVEHGRITAAQRAAWKPKFAGDFVTAANELAALKPNGALKTVRHVQALPREQSVVSASNEFAAARAKRNREVYGDKNYAQAHRDCMNDPALAGVVLAMNQGSGEAVRAAASA